MSLVCINCGSDKVERHGDAFTCHKCQFEWTVALEEANRVYLRAQGRLPATALVTREVEQPAPLIVTADNAQVLPPVPPEEPKSEKPTKKG